MREGPYGRMWPTQMAARRCPSGFAVIPGGDHMLKRIVMLVALAAALVACGSGTSSSPGAETLAPIDSAAPSASEMPSESACAVVI